MSTFNDTAGSRDADERVERVSRRMVRCGAGHDGYYVALVDAQRLALLVDTSCDDAEHAERCAQALAQRLAETLQYHLKVTAVRDRQ
jgi:predicted signal transduction protein with EAL and GGDEF domain